jgi:hypothetical protein
MAHSYLEDETLHTRAVSSNMPGPNRSSSVMSDADITLTVARSKKGCSAILRKKFGQV